MTISNKQYFITNLARVDYTDLGFCDEDVINIVMQLINRNLYKSMTTYELKRIRKKINLTQKDAGVLFGGGIRAFYKYETAETTQSKPLDILLRLIDLEKITIDDIKRATKSR